MPDSRRLRRDLIALLWQQPLWAVPFTIFYSVLYAHGWSDVGLIFKISLVFAYRSFYGMRINSGK